MVGLLKTMDDYKKCITDNKLVVIDFTATWCGPCKMVGPKFVELAPEFPNTVFVKIDVDENAEAAEACGISAMPTFQFYKDGAKVDEVVGASIEKVKEMVAKFN